MEIRIGDRVVDVTRRTNGDVAIGEQTFTVEEVGEGLYAVFDGTSRWRVAVAGPPDDCWVAVAGQVATVEVGARPRGPRRRRGGVDDMRAPMPATVLDIVVQAGQTVAKGDTLLVLEAMKMELPIRAPRDGRVAALHCRVGEIVQPGVPLLEIS